MNEGRIKDKILNEIRQLSEEQDYASLDEIAAGQSESTADEDIRAALAEAYAYHFGELSMDYAGAKYYSGDRLGHLDEILGLLSRLVLLSTDSFYAVSYSRFLREKAELLEDEASRKILLQSAIDLLSMRMDAEPEIISYAAELAEALTDFAALEGKQEDVTERAAALIEEMTAKLKITNLETVGRAVVYIRRISKCSGGSRLKRAVDAFDQWVFANLTTWPEVPLIWLSLHIHELQSEFDEVLFNHWYQVALQLPELVPPGTSGLSKLSYDIFSLGSALIEAENGDAGEKCLLLSLDLEALLYSGDGAGSSMAWRSLHFAVLLIRWYIDQNRIEDAAKLLNSQLDFGRTALAGSGSETSLHTQMSSLLELTLDLNVPVDPKDREEIYREIIIHCSARTEGLKQQFGDYMDTGGRKVWQYLYYVYEEDYLKIARYSLLLGRREEAIDVLNDLHSLIRMQEEELNLQAIDWNSIVESDDFAAIREELRSPGD